MTKPTRAAGDGADDRDAEEHEQPADDEAGRCLDVGGVAGAHHRGDGPVEARADLGEEAADAVARAFGHGDEERTATSTMPPRPSSRRRKNPRSTPPVIRRMWKPSRAKMGTATIAPMRRVSRPFIVLPRDGDRSAVGLIIPPVRRVTAAISAGQDVRERRERRAVPDADRSDEAGSGEPALETSGLALQRLGDVLAEDDAGGQRDGDRDGGDHRDDAAEVLGGEQRQRLVDRQARQQRDDARDDDDQRRHPSASGHRVADEADQHGGEAGGRGSSDLVLGERERRRHRRARRSRRSARGCAAGE